MCKRHYLVPAVNITVTYNNLISSIFCDILRACRISKMPANTRPSVDSEGLREPVYLWHVLICINLMDEHSNLLSFHFSVFLLDTISQGFIKIDSKYLCYMFVS